MSGPPMIEQDHGPARPVRRARTSVERALEGFDLATAGGAAPVVGAATLVVPPEASVWAEVAGSPECGTVGATAMAAARDGTRHPINRKLLRAHGLIEPDGPVTGLLEEFRIVKRQQLAQARELGAGARASDGNGGAAQRIGVVPQCSAAAAERRPVFARRPPVRIVLRPQGRALSRQYPWLIALAAAVLAYTGAGRAAAQSIDCATGKAVSAPAGPERATTAPDGAVPKAGRTGGSGSRQLRLTPYSEAARIFSQELSPRNEMLRSDAFRARGAQVSYAVDLGRLGTGVATGLDRHKFAGAARTVLAPADGFTDTDTWIAARLTGRINGASVFGISLYSVRYDGGFAAGDEGKAYGAGGNYSRAIIEYLSATPALAILGITRDRVEDIWNASALVGVRNFF
ncbi:MAG: hypothetical protein V4579_10035 [Pseudomonadota bacterium]